MEGLRNKKKTQKVYREGKKQKVKDYLADRDGPSFCTKQCQTCSCFIPSNAVVCQECGVPATVVGANQVAQSKDQRASLASNSTTSALSVGALRLAQLQIEPKRKFIVGEIHEDRGPRGKKEYLVQWAGYPTRDEWTWEPVSKVVGSALDRFLD